VILVVVGIILCGRVNPYLTSIALSGLFGFLLTSVFLKYGRAPAWVVPIGIVFWIAVASPHVATLLKTVIPQKQRRDHEQRH
jgi:phosphotransferase system  glucose/maltose/N-acetylglucosamine-specific IIC component